MDWSDKPWARPMMYTNDVDPSHGPQAGQATLPAPKNVVHHSAEDVEAMMNGESRLDRDERAPMLDLGDGRPDPSRVDRTPMIYRNAYSDGNEIDVDERDYLAAPAEYAPPTAPASAAPPRPNPEQGHAHAVRPRVVPNVQQALPPGMGQRTNNAPSAPHERAGTHMPPVPSKTIQSPRATLKAIVPLPGGTVLETCIGGHDFTYSPNDLEAMAIDMMAWAHAARAIRM